MPRVFCFRPPHPLQSAGGQDSSTGDTEKRQSKRKRLSLDAGGGILNKTTAKNEWASSFTSPTVYMFESPWKILS